MEENFINDNDEVTVNDESKKDDFIDNSDNETMI